MRGYFGLGIALMASIGVVVIFAVGGYLLLNAPMPSMSKVVLFADGTPMHVFLSADDKWRFATDSSQVDPRYLQALLRYEDQRYGYHPGVDPLALSRALLTNWRSGRRISGASTLTMQLARLLRPARRSVLAKAGEAAHALCLQLFHSKKTVLDRYLSLLPFGGNLEGVEAASWALFGHSAANLTPTEIVTLLAIPQDPKGRDPRSALGRQKLAKARLAIAARLLANGGLLPNPGQTAKALLAEMAAEKIAQPRPFPRHAPHFAYALREQLPAGGGRTSIERDTQQQIEGLVRQRRQTYRDQGINGLGILVMEQESGKLLAAVGGLDFWHQDPTSQIPSFFVPRSPGSALKPMLYALGLDLGLFLPQSLVEDVPRHFAAYQPRNFDGRFRGLVSMEDALAYSLNLPFVDLLSRIGVDAVVGKLTYADVNSLIAKPGHYGLALAAGGVELSAFEILGLYAALARGGEYVAPYWRLDRVSPKAKVLFSPGAAYLTREALRRRDRPDLPRRKEVAGLPRQVWWKTGTSFGLRDAWALGSYARYTVAVWLGNLDYKPSYSLVGSEVAAPLLFDILESLNRAAVAQDLPPKDIAEIKVCAYSGYLPGPACPETSVVLALQHRQPRQRCPYHAFHDIDIETGLTLAPQCRAGRQYARQTFLTWPEGVRQWLRSSQQSWSKAPELHPACERNPQWNSRLAITSPGPGQTIVLLPGLEAKRQLVPFMAEASDQGKLAWFVDGRYHKSLDPDERFWWQPELGVHEIVVSNAVGMRARRVLEVASNSP